jgi:hypothetical protein
MVNTASRTDRQERTVKIALRNTSWLLLLVALPLPAGAQWIAERPVSPDQQAPAFDTGPWPEVCQKYMIRYGDSGASHPVFSARAARNRHPAWWVLQWEGVNIPIPDLDYEHLILLSRNDGVIEIMLAGNNGGVALYRSMADAVGHDLFANVDPLDPQSDVQTTEQGRALTRTLFGGPVSLAELIVAGYRYGPDDITCKEENRARELMAMYGFPLVDMADPYEVQTVHENIGDRRGWLTQGTGQNAKGKFRMWHAVTLGSRQHKGLQIELWMVDEPRFGNIGLEIGETDARGMKSSSPAWLPALQRALDDDTPAQWKRLREQISESGLSRKSITALDRFTHGPGKYDQFPRGQKSGRVRCKAEKNGR